MCLEPLQSDAPSPLSTNEATPEARARQAWSRLSTSLRAAALDPEASLRLRGAIAAEQDALDHALRALGAAHLGALLRAAQPEPVVEAVVEAVVGAVVEADVGAVVAPIVALVVEPVMAPVMAPVAEPVVAPVPAAERLVEPPSAAAVVPVGASLCAALAASLNGSRREDFVTMVPTGPRSASAIRRKVGPLCAQTADGGALHLEVTALRAAVDASEWADPQVSPDLRHALLEWLSARVRVVLDLPALSVADRAVADRTMRALRPLAKGAMPQPAHGLAKDHRPRRGGWAEDALAAEAALDALLGDAPVKTPAPRSVDDLLRCLREHLAQGRRAEALACLRVLVERGVSAKEPRLLGALRGHADLLDGQAGEGPWKALRKALHREQAEAARDREAPAEADDEQPLPADWPLRGQTQGMRVILVGGDPRPYARDALQAAFGFASVAWPAIPDKAPRAVTSAVAQIKSGRFDLVLFLKRFAGHDVFDRCRATAESVRFVVCRGYGIGAVRVALERDLAHVA
jgi:hypothetical protein